MTLPKLLSWLLVFIISFFTGCDDTSVEMPHLEKRDGMTKLIVDGRPFICVAGELANSSSTDVETMKLAWPRLAEMNLNTILSVISWDLIEPQQGVFDFSMIDYQIEAARSNNLKLIFLWMGSWKNGMSHYPPRWVKANQDRFPRAVDADGHTLEVLSTLGEANRDADAKAFAAFMHHIKTMDLTARTFLDNPFVLIIHTAPDEYYFATNGNFPFRVSPRIQGDNITTASTVDRGYFRNGKWILSHRLNGDDIMLTYDLSGAANDHQSATIVPLGSRGRWNIPWAPAGGMSHNPTIWRVTFYQYH